MVRFSNVEYKTACFETSNSASDTLFSEVHDAVEKGKGWNSVEQQKQYRTLWSRKTLIQRKLLLNLWKNV